MQPFISQRGRPSGVPMRYASMFLIGCSFSGLCWAQGSRPATHAFPAPGEWPCSRRNANLDGHSPLMGKLASPRIAWKHFIGAYEGLMIASPGDDNATVNLSIAGAKAPPDTGQDPRWGLRLPFGNVEGREQQIPRDVY